MLSIFVNMGAGRKLMGIREFGQFDGDHGDYVIFNMDREEMDAPENANYETADANSILLQNGTVEILFAISPYGYYPLNPESYRVLVTDGVVVVAGTKGNKYFKKPYAAGCASSFVELNGFPGAVKQLIQRLGSARCNGNDLASENLLFKAFMKTSTAPAPSDA